MELVYLESSKVTYLTQLHNPSGMVYQPEAIVKIAQRYSFVKTPTADDLFKNERAFRVGKFENIQISELSIYNDGIIVLAACDSDIIEAFIDDLFGWAREEFGLIPLSISKPEKTYESNIVVKSTIDLGHALRPRVDVQSVMNKVYLSDKYTSSPLYPSGFIASINESEFQGRKKPIKFILDRRLGVDFDQLAFFSQAPLRTKDHLEVLRMLERLASEG